MEKRMTLQMNTPQSTINSIMTTIRTMTGSMQAPMEWLRAHTTPTVLGGRSI